MKWSCILLILIEISVIYSKLRFVFEMYRHGARSAFVDSNNTDIFNTQWEGDGESTPIGMRMHYLLGYRNRLKYTGFLSGNYTPCEIYIMSTDVNRTIMSAQAQLDGLYPPSTGPEIPSNKTNIAVPPLDIPNFLNITNDLQNDALKYRSQVFPIHVIPTDSREFYLQNPDHCPAVGAFIEQNLNNQTVINFTQSYKEKYSKPLIEALNFSDSQFDSFEFINDLSDAFVAGSTEGKNYTFLEKVGINLTEFNETAYECLYMNMFQVYYGDSDLFVGSMAMSPTHRDVIEWMDTRVDYDSKNMTYVTFKAPKLVMLSGHDSTLAAMQTYLRYIFPHMLTEYVYVPYASSLYYELNRIDTAQGYDYSDYYVDVIFNNRTMFSINYDDFRTAILNNSYTQEYIDHFCGFSQPPTPPLPPDNTINYILLIFTICLAVLSIGLIITVVILCCKKKNKETFVPYQSIV
jgi:hypothetical protein